MADLHNWVVVITRPRAQAQAWQGRLEALGARTALLPVLDIQPVASAAEREAVKARITDWADYHKIIFVSQNAVQHAMGWVDQYWPQLPVGQQYFAVGSATATSAESWGLRVQAADRAMNSEALLDLPALKTVQHEKVLICRGCGGRSYLGEQLRLRGAQVDYCELYHRALPLTAADDFHRLGPLWEGLRAGHEQAVVSVHSGESLQNFSQLTDDSAEPALAAAIRAGAVVLVPGTRVAEQAARLGFHRVLAAENATDAAMTQALQQRL